MQEPLLICGATGRTGRLATTFLLEKGRPVRALVHTDDARARALKELGAEVILGDLLDAQNVRLTLKDIKRACFVYPQRPGIVEVAAGFAQAARDAGVEFIVNMSQWTAGPDATSECAVQ